MNIKEQIKREALVGEATTIKVSKEEFDFNKKEIDKMKAEIGAAIDKIIFIMAERLGDKISSKEYDKQAESFIKNYLKGAYGK